jgi:Flp pilus assembly protein TadD
VAGGNLYNRQLALFYADHDRELERAYALASSEYALRRDIYGADALAWSALKHGKLAEAESAIHAALHLGTQDARLLYHAGMIAQAAGDGPHARDFLDRALRLSPRFDPMQARVAQQARSGSPGGPRAG